MYDFGSLFRVDIDKAKSISINTFRCKKYRISILSDVLIRFEYSETGSFNDYPTFLHLIDHLEDLSIRLKKIIKY